MADRSYRRLRAVLGACLIAMVVGCAPAAEGADRELPPPTSDPAASALVPEPTTPPPTTPPTTPPPAPTGPVRVLQLNLCNSGIAACYTGRSVDEAAALIRSEKPDLVTLNEVCRGDVALLERALADVVPGGAVGSAFQPARDGDSGQPYPCRNGQHYGNGVLSRWPAVPGSTVGGGIYPDQDPADPEKRAWTCLEVAATLPLAVCTTHLAYTVRAVTNAQCRYLFGTVVAELRAREGAAPVVVGGDFNLGPGDNPDLVACVPSGSALVDDGRLQHVVATPEYVVESAKKIDLRRTTDHPGLLVTLVPRA